jgi:hypothetical protein
VVALIDIEPGMVVAGRYVVSSVDRRWLPEKPEVGAVCTGLDAILDEPVLILVADAGGSNDVLEAARRVSILGDRAHRSDPRRRSFERSRLHRHQAHRSHAVQSDPAPFAAARRRRLRARRRGRIRTW